ncbi:MAG: SDR family NAD(P)-dependent oxidoreductase, partial [Thermoanaerobaculia bacterium]
MRWQPLATRHQEIASAEAEASKNCWLIFSDRGGVGRELSKRLRQYGETCVEVLPGRRYEHIGESTFRIDPESRQQTGRLLREAAGDGGSACPAVVHLWSLDSGTPEETAPESLEAAQRLGCGSFLVLAQTLAEADPATPPSLWLVTRGAQRVGTEASGPNVIQAPVWGLGRVVALEAPEIRGGLIDLPPEASAQDAAKLLGVIRGMDGENQLALRGGRWYVPRLHPGKIPPARPQALTLTPEGSYLITGGLGRLGLRLARFLVERGARHLILLGRRAPSGERLEAVRALEESGAEVRTEAADVGDAERLTVLIAELASSPHPLRGICHAAGVLEPRPLSELDVERLTATLRPKVAGTWALHQATRELELDFFICFSSISSVWGSAGMAHYAAANHFLDAIAHYRSSLGLPALTVNWGPWAGGGMVSDQALRSFERLGVASLPPVEALAALEALSASGAVQRTVADVDWKRFKPVFESRRHQPLLEHLTVEEQVEEVPSEAVAELRLSDVPAGERRQLLTEHLRTEVGAVLGLRASDPIDPRRGFFTLGMDSVTAVELRNRLEKTLGQSLESTVIFDYPSLERLGDYLEQQLLPSAAPPAGGETPRRGAVQEPIAVIGLGCRFPVSAATPEDFWRQLRDGVDAIGEVPPDRWDIDAYYDPDVRVPGKMYTRWGGFVDGVDRFDAQFFGISPREALSLDPQQRWLLEVAWEALENAGRSPAGLVGSRTGVFVGISCNDYLQRIVGGPATDIDAYLTSGNALNAAAGRLSYTLGLQGPSMAIDTACSSSLVAIHLACRSLRGGETDLALAGGVNVVLSPEGTINLCKARMMAADGRCKTFDRAADGYVRGEGCGIVVLKRLSEARADGDRILALVRGSAVNQDGPASGFTVPSGPAQQALVRDALADAGVESREIGYVEAHGTGTELGDPIEIGALAAVLGAGRSEDRPLIVGTVKTNIGHLESAAGVAGVIKVVLALQHGEIPPHLHLRELNPHIDSAAAPIRIPDRPMPWPETHGRRLAGVSAFGFSGTNAHLVLESAPEIAAAEAAPPEHACHLLSLSARSAGALRALAGRFADHLASVPEASLGDVCFSANVGRASFNHRLAVPARSSEELRDRLAAVATDEDGAGVLQGLVEDPEPPRVAFLFTGQGALRAGIGHQLYHTEPVFRRVLDRCDELLQPVIEGSPPSPLREPGKSLLTVLYPEPGSPPQIDEAAWAQPALFAIEVALAELWRSWGIEPAAVLGHSLGEYAAACVAGVFDLEDGLQLVAERGRLMQELPA